MINLLDTTLWTDRLKAECPAFSSRVFKTIPDDELSIDAHQSPVAFVYLSGDNSADQSLVGRTRQKTTSTVTVEIVVRRTAGKDDKFSEADSDLIRLCRLEIFTALIGWTAPNCIMPVEHANGELKKKEPKLLKWTDNFTTDNYQTK